MKVIYFDLDGTLLNSTQCSVITAQETFQKFCQLDIPQHKIIENMGIPIEISFLKLSNNQINNSNWEEVAAYFRKLYKLNSLKYTNLYDGIQDMLENISNDNTSLFVVTSKKSDVAKENLRFLKVSHYFEKIIGSDNVDHYKPHPDPIFQARKYIQNTDYIEIVVGDADTDIEMGKSAQVKTCAVTWGAHDKQRLQLAKPDYVAETVLELSNLLRFY